MRKVVLSLILSLLVFAAEARIIRVNMFVTDEEGCAWHIVGEVDVSASISWPPIKVNSYSLSASGPCGSHTFRGLVGPVSEYGGASMYHVEILDANGDKESIDSWPGLSDILTVTEGIIESGDYSALYTAEDDALQDGELQDDEFEVREKAKPVIK